MNSLNKLKLLLIKNRYFKGLSIKKYSNYDNQFVMDLEITLSSDCLLSDDDMIIKFFNVKNLMIGYLNPNVSLQINIFDKTSDQLEDINFYVIDEENSTFSFYCEKICSNSEEFFNDD